MASLSDSRSERLKLISKFWEKIKLDSYQKGETAKKINKENDIFSLLLGPVEKIKQRMNISAL